MAEEQAGGYGYTDEESMAKSSTFGFGLNAGNTFMKKFEWIPNGGKDGAEGEALDVVFDINGTEKSYRMFPVTKAYLADNKGETTDPKSPEMQEAFKNFNATISHILGCFVDKDALIVAFAVPVTSFKQYCSIAMGLLPANFREVALDIFMGWQWQFTNENTVTFLEIPKKMKYGKWLTKAVPAMRKDEAGNQIAGGSWKEDRKANPTTSDKKALRYLDEAGNEHPIFKNGWYMSSNYAAQQKEDNGAAGEAISAQPTNADGTPPAAAKGWD